MNTLFIFCTLVGGISEIEEPYSIITSRNLCIECIIFDIISDNWQFKASCNKIPCYNVDIIKTIIEIDKINRLYYNTMINAIDNINNNIHKYPITDGYIRFILDSLILKIIYSYQNKDFAILSKSFVSIFMLIDKINYCINSESYAIYLRYLQWMFSLAASYDIINDIDESDYDILVNSFTNIFRKDDLKKYINMRKVTGITTINTNNDRILEAIKQSVSNIFNTYSFNHTANKALEFLNKEEPIVNYNVFKMNIFDQEIYSLMLKRFTVSSQYLILLWVINIHYYNFTHNELPKDLSNVIHTHMTDIPNALCSPVSGETIEYIPGNNMFFIDAGSDNTPAGKINNRRIYYLGCVR